MDRLPLQRMSLVPERPVPLDGYPHPLHACRPVVTVFAMLPVSDHLAQAARRDNAVAGIGL